MLTKQDWLPEASQAFSLNAGSTSSVKHKHLVSQLKLLANLCEGRMQIPSLLSFLEEVAPVNALLFMVFDPALPSDIRAGALRVFQEVHIDTPGTTPRLSWEEKCRLYQDGDAIEAKMTNGYTKARQYNADLFVGWAVRQVDSTAAETGIESSCFRDVLVLFRTEVSKAVAKSREASASLMALMWFVRTVFQCLRFVIAIGISRREHLGPLLTLVLREFLDHHASFTSDKYELERDELTRKAAGVIDEAMGLIHILIDEASQNMNDQFLSCFCCLFAAISKESDDAEARFRRLPASLRRLRDIPGIMNRRDPSTFSVDDVSTVARTVKQLEITYNFNSQDEDLLNKCLHALARHPTPSVARSANTTLSLLYSRVESMFSYSRDSLLLTPDAVGADSFYNNTVQFGGVLYQIAFETQIDDQTAQILQQQAQNYRASLMDERGFPSFVRQNTAFRLHIVHHLLAIFDQELEGAPDESLGFASGSTDGITPVHQALAAVLQLVEEITNRNPEVRFIFP